MCLRFLMTIDTLKYILCETENATLSITYGNLTKCLQIMCTENLVPTVCRNAIWHTADDAVILQCVTKALK